jgi:hypothetical protein
MDVTMPLLKDGICVHTQCKQMGTSVLMLKRNYSELTAAMAENRFT